VSTPTVLIFGLLFFISYSASAQIELREPGL
jgi:hypothetical protein